MTIASTVKKLFEVSVVLTLIENGSSSFDLHRITRLKNFYQVTSIVSENFTKKSAMFHEYPNKIYSFATRNHQQRLYDNFSENTLKNTYSLQESFLIFYTNNLNEVQSFIDYLVPQLSVRQRPKSLIICSKNPEPTDEIDTVSALKYAWDKKFLDFSMITLSPKLKTIIDSFTFAYYYNPFNGIIRKLKLNYDTEIFPDKLKNAHEYPFHAAVRYSSFSNTLIKRGNKQEVLIISRNDFVIDFIASSILNLKVVNKTEHSKYLFPDDYIRIRNFDMVAYRIFNKDYSTNFLVPAVDQVTRHYVAFVPILATSRINLFFKLLYNVAIVFGIVFIFLYIFSYLTAGNIRAFYFAKLLLGQSIAKEPQKAAHRIIMLTVFPASVIIMNNAMTDIISVQFEKREVPFETYEDLCNSKLKTYTSNPDLKYLQNVSDPHLSKIINGTSFDANFTNCLDLLLKWKNVSCIKNSLDAEYIISYHRDPTRSPAMKIASPPLYSVDSYFYWFADASPYALKFLKIMRRVHETSLVHWPALFDKDAKILLIEDKEVTFDDGINLEQLLTVLGFGFFTSAVVFILELFEFKKN